MTSWLLVRAVKDLSPDVFHVKMSPLKLTPDKSPLGAWLSPRTCLSGVAFFCSSAVYKRVYSGAEGIPSAKFQTCTLLSDELVANYLSLIQRVSVIPMACPLNIPYYSKVLASNTPICLSMPAVTKRVLSGLSLIELTPLEWPWVILVPCPLNGTPGFSRISLLSPAVTAWKGLGVTMQEKRLSRAPRMSPTWLPVEIIIAVALLWPSPTAMILSPSSVNTMSLT